MLASLQLFSASNKKKRFFNPHFRLSSVVVVVVWCGVVVSSCRPLWFFCFYFPGPGPGPDARSFHNYLSFFLFTRTTDRPADELSDFLPLPLPLPRLLIMTGWWWWRGGVGGVAIHFLTFSLLSSQFSFLTYGGGTLRRGLGFYF